MKNSLAIALVAILYIAAGTLEGSDINFDQANQEQGNG